MILRVMHLLFVHQVATNSLVQQMEKQEGIYVSDYCPSTLNCPEGTHVLCMFHDLNNMFGPRCQDPQNIAIVPDIAKLLLDVINKIRMRIVSGKETDNNGRPLPKGYGIFKLKWDNELATFAQVLANQCTLKKDFCRATKKFHSPGQLLGLKLFTIPDWLPVSGKTNDSFLDSRGLNSHKIRHAVTKILKFWYSQKAYVTEAMIESAPELSNNTYNEDGHAYLTLVRGSTTHMGCGMSAYTAFGFPENTAQSGFENYYTVLLVCNFSSDNKPGESIYYTTRKNFTTNRCGCPVGSHDDPDCLCVIDNCTKSKIEKIETCRAKGNCDSTVVLLPIFAIEDAPPEKFIGGVRYNRKSTNTILDNRYTNRSAIQRTNSLDLFEFFEDAEKERQKSKVPVISYPINTKFNPTDPESMKFPIPAVKSLSLSLPYNMRQRLGSRKQTFSIINDKNPPRDRMFHVPSSTNKKSSIFTRVPKFRLPNERSYSHYEAIIPDVKPRKNFKNMDRVVNEYIKERDRKLSSRKRHITENKRGVLDSPFVTSSSKTREFTKTVLNTAEEKVMNFNKNLQQKLNESSYDYIQHYTIRNNENDKKLLNLLDNLEQEVKHVELDGKEKQIFDSKIKKIYGSVVGVPSVLSVTVKPNYKQSHSLLLATSPPDDTDYLEGDIKGSKYFLKRDDNQVLEDDRWPNYEPGPHRNDYSKKLDMEEKNNRLKNYEIFEPEHKDIWNHIENDVENVPKLVTNIERKHNDSDAYNYPVSKLKRKYNDNDELDFFNNLEVKNGDNPFDHQYRTIDDRNYEKIPASRSQNDIGKYENLNYNHNLMEDKKYRVFNKYRSRESIPIDRPIAVNKNHYRKRENGIKHVIGVNKREQSSLKLKEDDPERNKYYEEDLENTRHTNEPHRRKTTDDKNPRILRKMRPNLESPDRPTSIKKRDSFYMPERAKFLHGF